MLSEELETIKKDNGVRGSVARVGKWSRKESSRSFCSHPCGIGRPARLVLTKSGDGMYVGAEGTVL